MKRWIREHWILAAAIAGSVVVLALFVVFAFNLPVGGIGAEWRELHPADRDGVIVLLLVLLSLKGK